MFSDGTIRQMQTLLTLDLLSIISCFQMVQSDKCGHYLPMTYYLSIMSCFQMVQSDSCEHNLPSTYYLHHVMFSDGTIRQMQILLTLDLFSPSWCTFGWGHLWRRWFAISPWSLHLSFSFSLVFLFCCRLSHHHSSLLALSASCTETKRRFCVLKKGVKASCTKVRRFRVLRW